MPITVAPLEAYPLRSIWADEARHFTPWLAQPDALAQLGKELGLDQLELEATEQPIGDFSLDILARDPLGHRVVIENQLEPTDHKHLGQLLTYAAGTEDGLTVVWVAAAIRSEHAAALRWLNAMTPPHIGFYGVEITAWSINGSGQPGYQFRIAVKPDRQERDGEGGRRTPLSAEQIDYQAYWAAFRKELEAQSAQHWLREKPPRGTWYGKNVGRPGFNFYALLKPKERALAVALEISTADHEAHFSYLQSERSAIDTELGGPAQWTSTGARDYVTVELHDVDFQDQSKWPDQHAWLIAQLERFRAAFTQRIIALPVTPASDQLQAAASQAVSGTE
jgi:hypothetical protein